jgi:hypothetical protein
LCLQLTANPEANVGHVTLVTPYGMSAVFGVAIPGSHAWARPRRVADLLPHVEIQMPKEAGFLSKRVEMAPLRIERFFIAEVTFAERSGVLRLRKGPGSGSGYELQIDLETGVSLTIRPMREDGTFEEQPPQVLLGNDQATILSLWQGVVQSAVDLMHLRQRMVSASFNGRPLLELDSPRVASEALVNYMAPVISEISRRSGAPGELVLRRNLGEGRREETYCTHAELLEKIMVLPPDLRAVFSSLHLTGSGQPLLLPPPALAAPELGSRAPARSSLAVPAAPEELAPPLGVSAAHPGAPPESSPPPAA